jgi:hypothetical protein
MLAAWKIIGPILLLMAWGVLYAQDRRLALARRVQGLEQLPPAIARQLERLTLQVITKQKDLDLLISGSDTPDGSTVDVVAIESEVAKSGETYRIETRLLDLKSKKLLAKASRDQIREEDLIRLFQGALESLFLPDQEIDKEMQSKPTVPPAATEKAPTKRPRPISTQVTEPDKASLDFKQRVKDLKHGVDVQITKEAELNASIAEAQATKESVAASTQNAITPKPVTEANEPLFEKPPAGKLYPRRLSLVAGWDKREIESLALIRTKTTATLLTIKGSGHAPLRFFNGSTAVSYDFAYTRVLSAPVEPPALYQLGVYASWLSNFWNISGGLYRDATFFVNVGSPGEGNLPYSLTSTWMKVKTEVLLHYKGAWKIGVSFGVPWHVTNNFQPLKEATKWSGSNFEASLTPPFSWHEWETNLSIQKINLTTQGVLPFTLNESRTALSVRRSL